MHVLIVQDALVEMAKNKGKFESGIVSLQGMQSIKVISRELLHVDPSSGTGLSALVACRCFIRYRVIVFSHLCLLGSSHDWLHCQHKLILLLRCAMQKCMYAALALLPCVCTFSSTAFKLLHTGVSQKGIKKFVWLLITNALSPCTCVLQNLCRLDLRR